MLTALLSPVEAKSLKKTKNKNKSLVLLISKSPIRLIKKPFTVILENSVRRVIDWINRPI